MWRFLGIVTLNWGPIVIRNQRFYTQEEQQQRLWGGTEFPEEEQKSEVAKLSAQSGRQCEGRPNGEVAASLNSSNFTPRAADIAESLYA